jgi:DNA-binding transcriptional regulator YdaS (Cro superfamily)
MSPVRELIKAAIAKFGSEAKLADVIGVTQPSINEAKQKGRVSVLMALRIDQATGGEVSKHDLRPDVFPRDEACAS